MTAIQRPARVLTSFLLCAALILSLFTFKASAGDVCIWDGKSALETGKTYFVTDTVKVRSELTIPAGSKLSVREGGSLRIMSAGSLIVNGELAVAIGGSVKNSGRLAVKKGGSLNIYGLFQTSVNGVITVSGNITVYNRGVFESSSDAKFFTSSSVYVKNRFCLYKSSDSKISGKITGTAASNIELRGNVSLTLSGEIDLNGHLTVGAASNVRVSGKISLSDTATYTRFTAITVTRSGKFIDKRPRYEYNNMTVDILIDEPDVERRGIDVSWAQGEYIDWEKVAASGIDFVIIRAGRGRAGEDNTLAEDKYFRRNIEEAQKYGIDVGVYFYSYATTVAEAEEEARFFVEIIDGYRIQYPVILDLEETFQGKIGKKKLTNMIDAFFSILMENNYFPMLYSYKSWIEQYLDMSELDKYAVWLAQVSDEVTYDGGYYIWQYSFTGKVSGIVDYRGELMDVDLDISYKDWPSIFRRYGLNNM
ncbi:MAG: glycoside hydrolase family 25 protein [Ruminiclostridium sp.]|nr:glycoside hydrolase family 25 protein [Ruminiclostridium sp.]